MISFHAPIRRRRFLGLAGAAAGLAATAPLTRFLDLNAALATAAGFPLTPEAASRILAAARARGAAFADLYLEHSTVTRLTLAEQSIESVEQGVHAGGGVRAVDGHRTGYAFADSYDEKPLVQAATDAAAIAARAGVKTAPTTFQKTAPPRAIVRCVRPLDAVSEDERVGWIRRADEAARAYDPTVEQVTIEYVDAMTRFAVINSDGLWIEDTVPLIFLRINVIAGRNGKRGTGSERLSYRRGAEQMDADAAGRAGQEAARQAVAMIEAAEAPAGEMPVIIGAGGGVLFHEAIGHGLEGDGVWQGTSFYAGRVGEKVGSARATIVDSGAIPDLRGSYNVDDEGTPAGENRLIEQGVLKGFLTDRIAAEMLGAPRTGSGRRQSYRFPPLVRMSNTYLDKGEDDVEEIVRATKSGIYARALGGGEVDTTSGNFTFGVIEAYRIEDGKLGAPVRGANLVGNGPEILRRIDRVGPDLKFWNGTCGKGQWVPVTSGAPTFRIASMTVGGSRQG
jgi:TldD protein